jgi:hypothetical protein
LRSARFQSPRHLFVPDHAAVAATPRRRNLSGFLLLDRTCCEIANNVEDHMPILLWLLGVPLSLIVILMLLGGL